MQIVGWVLKFRVLLLLKGAVNDLACHCFLVHCLVRAGSESRGWAWGSGSQPSQRKYCLEDEIIWIVAETFSLRAYM